MGKGRVDVERLLGDALLLVSAQSGDRAHVVQAVGQLDQEHPDVLGHGHEHLAHGGGLLRLLGVEADAVQLGDAVDDCSHVVAELGRHLLEGDAGVLHGIVQQSSRQRDVVEAQLREDLGDGHRVLDVGVTRAPKLPLVGGPSDLVGAGDQRRVCPRVVRPECGEERRQLFVGGVGRSRRAPRWRGRPPPPQDLVDRGHAYSYTRSETRFGTAMSPLAMSANDHTAGNGVTAPTITAATQRTR